MKKHLVLFLVFLCIFSFCGNFCFFHKAVFSTSAVDISFEDFNKQFTTLVEDDDYSTYEIETNSTIDELLSKVYNQEATISTFATTNSAPKTISENNIDDICEELDLVYSKTVTGYELLSKYAFKRIIVTGKVTNSFGAKNVLTYDDYNILFYETEEQTAYAYENLKEDSSLIVCLDGRIELNSSCYYEDYTNHWGTEAVDLQVYNNYLQTNNSNEEVVVAVIDTGAKTSHSMLKNRILTDDSGNLVYYTVDNTNDTNGHGSHVSGIITEMTPSNVKILPMKVFPDSGDSLLSYVTTALQALTSSTYSKYNIVAANLSLGNKDDLGSDLTYWVTQFSSAFTTLRNNNILPIAAAGNESQNTSLHVPAACENAVTVSALKGPNYISGNTLYIMESQHHTGSYTFDTSYSNFGSAVDISAPGTGISSADISSNTSTDWKAGTSQAAPHVAAAVALFSIDKLRPTATASDIEKRLYSCTIDLGDSGKDIYYGYGMLNLEHFNGNITHSATDTTATYNGNYHNISVSVSDVENYSIYYGLTAETCTISDISTNEIFKNFTNGAQTIYYKITAPNCIDSFGYATLTINKAEIGITTYDQTSIYGEPVKLSEIKNTNYTIIGTVYGSDDLGVKLSTTATKTSNVGNYNIIATITNTNYNATVTCGKHIITNRPVEITLNKQTSTYGEEINLSKTAYTLANNSMSVVNGDNLIIELSHNASSTSPVNSYEYKVDEYNPNYSLTSNTGTLEITQRTVKISVTKTSTYGDEIDLTVSSYTIKEGSVVSGDNLGLNINAEVSKTSDVGSYPITLIATNSNYNVITVSSYYIINYRSVNIVPTPQSFTYGEDIQTLLNQNAYIIENIANNEDINVTLSTTATNLSKVGNFSIKSSFTADEISKNYSISCKTGTLTINQRNIEIVASNQSFEYGEPIVLSNSYSILPANGIVNNDAITVSLSTNATTGNVVGDDYEIIVSATQPNNNYNITLTNGTLEITKRQITITIENQTSIFGKEINLKQDKYSVTSEKGIYNSDNLYITLTTNATSSSPIGDYDIDLTYNNANYDVEIIKGTLSIKEKGIVVDIQTQTFNYGDNINLNNALISSDDDISALNIQLKTSANNFSPVGKYDIVLTCNNPNITINYDGVNKVVINPKDLSLQLENQSCTYGEVKLNQNKLTVGQTANNENVEITLSTNANNASPVDGEYNITASTTNTNYNLVFENAKLTITKKNLTINLENQTLTYGNIVLNQSKYTLSQQPYNNDDLNFKLKTDANNASNVGSNYSINFEFNNNNYNITGNTATLTIEKRNIEISIQQYVVYGNEFVLDKNNYTVTSELKVVNDDDLNLSLIGDYSYVKNVKNYPVVVEANNLNYNVTITSAYIEVTPKEIIINIGNNSSIYGDIVDVSNTSYTQSEPFIVGDDIRLEISTTANNTSAVGNQYLITATTVGEDYNNYSVTINNGTLSITPRPVTLEVENQQGLYGAEINLKLQYKVTSERKIVNNDEELLQFKPKTTATKNSTVGTYPLTLTYTANANYDITIIDGEFIIAEGDLLVTILPQEFYYGEEINLNQLAFETNIEIDKSSLLITLTTSATSTTDVGNHYSILGSSSNENFKIVFNSGTLTIKPRPLTINILAQSAIYGDVTIDQTKYTTTDVLTNKIVNIDNLGITLSTEADEFQANGNYTIIHSHTNKNYTIEESVGLLHILPRPIKIKICQFGTYGNSHQLDVTDFSVVEGSIVNNDDLQLMLHSSINNYSSVDKYDIEIKSHNQNYNITLDSNSYYEIKPRDLTISVAVSSSYGSEIDFSSANITIVSGSIIGTDKLNPTFHTPASKTSQVGTYEIEMVDANHNYNITLINSKVVISKAKLIIEAIKSCEYGKDIVVDNTYNIVEGFVLPDDELNINFSTNATKNSKVDKYSLSFTYQNNNYDIELTSNSAFVITPRTIYVKIGDQSSEYGNDIVLTNSNISISSGSIIENDNLNITLSTSATKNSQVGFYPISGVCNNANYNAVFTFGRYEITKRHLTIKLHNQSTSRGPTFNINQNAWEIVDGTLAPNDNIDVEIYADAGNWSIMGYYTLQAKINNSNYDVELIEGDLFLGVSFIDVSIVVITIGIIAIITIKIIKHRKAKKKNQEMFDKWIKW